MPIKFIAIREIGMMMEWTHPPSQTASNGPEWSSFG